MRGFVLIALLGAGPGSGLIAPSALAGQGPPPSAVPPGKYPFTAADVHFITGMIGHHAQAIVMAGWAPTHGAEKSIRVLSERIINAQQDEIDLMSQWLVDRKQPVPPGKWMPMAMAMPGMDPGERMPGMLTDEQMTQLDHAHGTEFDRLFLTFMIQHHQGAVSMVQQLFATPGAGQDEAIFKLASDVNVDQTTEINRMQLMLNSLSRK